MTSVLDKLDRRGRRRCLDNDHSGAGTRIAPGVDGVAGRNLWFRENHAGGRVQRYSLTGIAINFRMHSSSVPSIII